MNAEKITMYRTLEDKSGVVQQLPTTVSSQVYDEVSGQTVAEQLAQKANKDEIVNVKNFKCSDGKYVLGDGVHDDVTGIQAALDYAKTQNKKIVYIPMGVYMISSALNVDGNQITIQGASKTSTWLKITGTNNGINLNGGERITIKDLTIDGNVATDYGLTSITGYGIYCNGARIVNFKDVWLRFLGNNAIHLNGGCWNYVIDGVDIDQIKGDGINFIATGELSQKNAINIINTYIKKTNGHGISAWGVDISIVNTCIQSSNGAGIYINPDTVTGNLSARQISIKNSYFEENRGGQIFAKINYNAPNARYINGLKIESNYFKLEVASANVGVTAQLIFDGNRNMSTTGFRNLEIENNEFSSNDNMIDVDGRNQLGERAVIRNVYNMINQGYARVITTTLSEKVFPGYIYARGIPYSNINYSDDVPSGTKIYFPVTLPYFSQYRNMGIFVDTDSTNYTVTFRLKKRDKKSVNAYVDVISSSHSGVSSAYIESDTPSSKSISHVESTRFIGNEIDYIAEITITRTVPGTFLRIGSLSVTHY